MPYGWARLVHVTINHEGRRYEARREAIDSACDMLNQFFRWLNSCSKIAILKQSAHLRNHNLHFKPKKR